MRGDGIGGAQEGCGVALAVAGDEDVEDQVVGVEDLQESDLQLIDAEGEIL
jgi:hypothetical protein